MELAATFPYAITPVSDGMGVDVRKTWAHVRSRRAVEFEELIAGARKAIEHAGPVAMHPATVVMIDEMFGPPQREEPEGHEG